jgi:hypothetical protein
MAGSTRRRVVAEPGERLTALQAEDERLLHRVREDEDVTARAARLEDNPRPAREPKALDERAAAVPDHHYERPTRGRVLELDVDLARRAVKLHFEPDGRDRLDHEELR